MKNKMKIVFMGTPDAAAECLDILVRKRMNIVGVFTRPDRSVKRSAEPVPPPVKKTALKYELKVFQPEKVSADNSINLLKELSPDLIVVVAFGEIFKKEVLDIPPLGCINLHFSLLPQFRGAAPVQWAVIKGARKTGVTVFFLNEDLDGGDIIMKKELDILPSDTAGTLVERLSKIGGDVLAESIGKIASGKFERVPQGKEGVSMAPKLNKEDGRINWNKSASETECFIKGVYPWPGAFTSFDRSGKRIMIKVHRARVAGGKSGKPGEVMECSDKLVMSCGKGAIEIIEVQPEGKGRISAVDFINGYHLKQGDCFD
ncbi:MAG: methionyl-tRNA formyltransferase [Candidatus Auribacterota bacterium]|nr:methionyl-tRNA formyltransferase [Candidatus Auribacterota bacterium]